MSDSNQKRIFSNNERASIINELSKLLSQTLPADEYAEMAIPLMKCSDEELAYLISALTKEDNSKSNASSSLILSEKENERFCKYLRQYKPDSHFCMDVKGSKAFISLSPEMGYGCSSVSSDVFFAGNVPFPRCEITIEHYDDKRDCVSTDNSTVIIFDKYEEKIKEHKGNKESTEPVCIGSVILDASTKYPLSVCMPIAVLKGCDYVLFGGIGYQNMSFKMINGAKKFDSTLEEDISSHAGVVLLIWAGIQKASLDPRFKNLFQNPEEEMTLCDNTDDSGKNKLKIQYMNKYVISDEDIKKIMGKIQ